MYAGGTRRDSDAARADVAVGDVNLTALHCAHGIAIEHQVAVVDAQHSRSLAYDRLVAALERRAAGGFAHSRRARRGRLRSGDAVTGPGLEHTSRSDLREIRGGLGGQDRVRTGDRRWG